MAISNETFFITGGAGFVGSNITKLLIEKGAKIVVYDNLSSGRLDFLKTFKKNKNFEFIKADLLDRETLEKSLQKSRPDTVVHLAANPDVRLGAKVTDLDLKQGTLATYNVLEACRKSDVKNLMFSSSSVVYGVAGLRPTPESYGPLKPISLYGASKLAGEALISSFGSLFGIKYFIYRLANVVGRNETHGIVVDFIKKLGKDSKNLEVLGNGKQKKSYIDVEDCVEAMLYVYKNSKDSENIFNLSTDDQMSVGDIASAVTDSVAPKARIIYTGTEQGWPGDVPDTCLSNKKMKEFGVRLNYTKSKDAIINAINVLKNP
ncbi:MAG: NAD-dependent epimerase/dehydratase family protein [Candidatus Micrarchaeota archaeon]|nr:NAD-dependent epimerase/dehydratase family protein [Candidatus Micrarchaeota archaeon]MDE1834870.1 NAD-dependent epimerase/dehydratase family protein [Candidatus Micrarchaeota archaeon]MDE1859609.1 NAD-dependent epimerase/dehydratase family protein [Candidatus Micrarchaeota archaeon]